MVERGPAGTSVSQEGQLGGWEGQIHHKGYSEILRIKIQDLPPSVLVFKKKKKTPILTT